MPIMWDAIALNREQTRTLVQNSDITQCRDMVHAHAKKEGYPPLIWATGYYELIGLTEDGPSPLTPFQIRYKIIQRNGANDDTKS